MMSAPTSLLALLLLLCTMLHSTTALGSKILVVDEINAGVAFSPSATLATEIFNAIGIPFDAFSLDTTCISTAATAASLATTLTNTATDSYYAIVVTHTNMKEYVAGDGCQALAAAIADYSWRQNVRIARLGAAPLTNEATFVSVYVPSKNLQGAAAAQGVNFGDIQINGALKAETIKLTDFAKRLLAGSDYRKSGVISSLAVSTAGIGITHYPVQVQDPLPANPRFTVDPLLIYREETYQADTVLAALEYWPMGGSYREEIRFYFPQADWSPLCEALHPLWLVWVTRGVYLGDRRVMLSTQIDDVLLNTPFEHDTDGVVATHYDYTTGGGCLGYDCTDPEVKAIMDQYNSLTTKANHGARFAGADMDRLAAWQKQIVSQFPKGSNYRVEFACNWDGSLEFLMLQCPAGGGGTVNPTNPSSFTTGDTAVSHGITHAREFFWESHTYSHLSLTCDDQVDLPATDCGTGAANPGFNKTTTAARVASEVTLNRQNLVSIMLQPALGADLNVYWSDSAMVTPGISGTYIGSSLQALHDNGILYIVGDNTRFQDLAKNRTLYDQYLTQDWICSDFNVDLLKHTIDNLLPTNPYEPLFTTVAVNGYGTGQPTGSVTIVPRWGTNIYYDASQEIENAALYQFIYKEATIRPFDDIIRAQAKITLPELLRYRHDPNMNHQANLRFFPWSAAKGLWPLAAPVVEGKITYTCLTCLFVEYAWDEYKQLFELPLITLKHTDMALLLIERWNRNRCGITMTLNKNATGFVNSATIQTTASCVVPLSGVLPADSTPATMLLKTQLGDNLTPLMTATNDMLHWNVYGPERTAYLQMTANVPYELVFKDPVQFFTPRLKSNASCTISIGSCPARPQLVGTFRDIFAEDNLQASLSQDGCLARASAYMQQCNVTKGESFSALFTNALGVQSTFTVCQAACKVCGQGVCAQCVDGLFVSSANKTCEPCPSGCTQCNETMCFQCQAGKIPYLKQCVDKCPPTTYNASGICLPCMSGCLSCNASTCLQCDTNSTMSFLYQGGCVSMCPNGTRTQGQECIACSPGCLACSPSQCLLCAPNAFFYKGGCVSQCPSDSFLDANSTCTVCQQPCLSCSAPSFCLSCNNSLVAMSGLCVTSCTPPAKLSADGKSCYTCPTHCSSCTQANQCSACDSTYMLFNASSCVTDCPTGSFKSGSACVFCPSSCTSCSSATACLACVSPFFLSAGACVGVCPTATYPSASDRTCQACSDWCSVCTSSTVCSQCSSGYTLANGVCHGKSSSYSTTWVVPVAAGVGAVVIVCAAVVCYLMVGGRRSMKDKGDDQELADRPIRFGDEKVGEDKPFLATANAGAMRA